MMPSKKNIVLIGGGGHCKSCIDVIESTGLYNIKGILDLPSEFGKKVLNYSVIGNDDNIEKYHLEGDCFIITAGQIKSASLRKKLFERLIKINAQIETIVASTARVSVYSKIGKGTIVMHHTLVNADAEIGENCIINSSSTIEHDVKIGNHSHISTNSVVNGDCKIGSENFIGSGSCISNGVEIGNNVVVGAGSLVVKNLSESGIYIGNPVFKIK